jgi:hypothetical protein
VAQAILNSPNASPLLKSYANQVGALAMFESGGNLGVYNGTCCTGILQMNTANIKATTGLTQAEFAALPLQAQVNAWSTVMSSALTTAPVKALLTLGNIGGSAVDGNMVLACVQLGVGNCMKMVLAGSCNGFADVNGTTICKMASKIASFLGASPTPSTPSKPTAPAANVGAGGSFQPALAGACMADGTGDCVPMNQALSDGFQQGSGVEPSLLRSAIQALTVALCLVIFGSSLLNMLKGYGAGVLHKVDVLDGTRRVFIGVAIVLVVMSVV